MWMNERLELAWQPWVECTHSRLSQIGRSRLHIRKIELFEIEILLCVLALFNLAS